MKNNETRYGAPFFNCVSGEITDSPTELTRKDFDEAIKTLVMNDHYTALEKDPSLEERYGCAPVSNYYFSFVPESLVSTVKNILGFISVSDYPLKTFVFKNEIGCLGNARIIKCADESMIREDMRSSNDKRIFWIDFCNDLAGPSLLRLRCILKDK